MEKPAPGKESSPDTTKQEIQLSSHLQESRLRSNSNTYVTFTLSPSVQQRAQLEAMPMSCDNLTNLKEVGVAGLSSTDLCNSELALTIPLSLCLHGGSQVIRTNDNSPFVDNRTLISDSNHV